MPAITQDESEFVFGASDFARIRRILHEYAGISLGESKRSMVYNRLVRRLRACNMTRFDAYLDFVESDASEHEACMNALTTNLTSFFRESRHFEILADYIVSRNLPRMRIWCAASSTGEEPYSIAMTVLETYNTDTPPVEIIASDIDTEVLAHAARGVYAVDRLDTVSDARRARFFERGHGKNAGFARVRPMLQKLIEFRQINLQSSTWPIPSGIDVIFCRNVLIYFEAPLQQRIIRHFGSLLAPNGMLITGHSENVTANDIFIPLGHTVYRPRGAAR